MSRNKIIPVVPEQTVGALNRKVRKLQAEIDDRDRDLDELVRENARLREQIQHSISDPNQTSVPGEPENLAQAHAADELKVQLEIEKSKKQRLVLEIKSWVAAFEEEQGKRTTEHADKEEIRPKYIELKKCERKIEKLSNKVLRASAAAAAAEAEYERGDAAASENKIGSTVTQKLSEEVAPERQHQKEIQALQVQTAELREKIDTLHHERANGLNTTFEAETEVLKEEIAQLRAEFEKRELATGDGGHHDLDVSKLHPVILPTCLSACLPVCLSACLPGTVSSSHKSACVISQPSSKSHELLKHVRASGAKNPDLVTAKLIDEEIETFEDLLGMKPQMLESTLRDDCGMKKGSMSRLVNYCDRFRGTAAAADGGSTGTEAGIRGGGGGRCEDGDEGRGGAAEVMEQAGVVSPELEKKGEPSDSHMAEAIEEILPALTERVVQEADEATGYPSDVDKALIEEILSALTERVAREADEAIGNPSDAGSARRDTTLVDRARGPGGDTRSF